MVPDLVAGPVLIVAGLVQILFRKVIGRFVHRTTEPIFTRLGELDPGPQRYANGSLLTGTIFVVAGAYVLTRGLGIWQ
jgi:hypothetical protein